MVTLLSLHPRMPFGGAERVIETVARGLVGNGFRFHFATLYDEGPVGEVLRSAGFPVSQRFARGRLDLLVYFRLRRLIRTVNPDVLCVTESPLPLFWAGVLRRRGQAPPLVVSIHSMGHLEGSRPGWLSKRAALPVAEVVVVLSETHREYVIQYDGAPRELTRIIPNGVDAVGFSPSQCKREARRQVGFPPECFNVGVVGTLRPEKNVEMFLEVARLTLQKIDQVYFHVVGGGPRLESLRRKCDELGVGRNVQFWGAIADVAPFVKAFDLQLLTSDLEAFPLVLLEAMACGVPVCATDVGCVRDIVTEGVNGYVCPPRNAIVMAEHVIRLAKDPQLCARLGKEGRRLVELHYTRETMVARYGDLFLEVAGKGKE